MPRPISITYSPTASDANGITTSVTPAAGGEQRLDIDGTLATHATDRNGVMTATTLSGIGDIDLGANIGAVGIDFDAPTLITIYGGSDESGVSFTITGRKGENEGQVTETLTGPNNSTVYSTNPYRHIDNIRASAGTTGDIEIGVHGVAELGTAQHITVTSAGNDSGRTFTIKGFDRFGNQWSKTLTGANATAAVSAENFKSVYDLLVDDDTAGAVEVGVDGTFEGGWIGLNMQDLNVAFAAVIETTATVKVQHTLDDIQVQGFEEDDATAIDHSSFTSKSSTDDGNYTNPPRAIRLACTSHTSGDIEFQVVQAY